MKTDFHHVYSKGETVIFRDTEDYIYFQNRLAIEKYGKNIKILAFSIMSSHIHLIVETWDEGDLQMFITGLKKAYAMYFNSKYNISIPADFLKIEYSDDEDTFESKKTRFGYVLRNPIHHQICGSPFSYEFSSAKYTYWDSLFSKREQCFYLSQHKKIRELNTRDRRQIVRRNEIDEDTLVDVETKAISPLSIIDIPKARAYWGKYVRSFILDLHLKPKDSQGEYIQEDALCVQSEKMSDLEVCQIIDTFAKERGFKSFAFIKNPWLTELINFLKRKLITLPQIDRCLWTNS